MSRKAAREKAMQFLFQLEKNDPEKANSVIEIDNIDLKIERFLEDRTYIEDDEESQKYIEDLKSRNSVFDVDSENETAVARAKEGEFFKEDFNEGIIVPLNKSDITYFKKIINNILNNKDYLDNIYSKYLRKWTLERLPRLERVLLRIGTYEIIMDEDIPNSVAINEVVDLCHKFTDEDSYIYINAILAKVNKFAEQKNE